MATAAQPEPTAETKSALVDLANKIAGSPQEEEKSSSGVALPIALILLGLVIVGFAVLGIMLVMSRRKAAQLASQVRQLEEGKLKAKEEGQFAINDKEREDAKANIAAMQTKIEGLTAELQSLQVTNKERVDALAKITNWDDLVVVDRRGEK